jgi:hypothetical protein
MSKTNTYTVKKNVNVKGRYKYYFPKFLVFRFAVCHKDTTSTTEKTLSYQRGCEKANLVKSSDIFLCHAITKPNPIPNPSPDLIITQPRRNMSGEANPGGTRCPVEWGCLARCHVLKY